MRHAKRLMKACASGVTTHNDSYKVRGEVRVCVGPDVQISSMCVMGKGWKASSMLAPPTSSSTISTATTSSSILSTTTTYSC